MNHTRRRKKAVPTTIGGVIAVLIGLAITHYTKQSQKPATPDRSPPDRTSTVQTAPKPQNEPRRSSSVGFTSRASLESHFLKHGSEFGDITQEEYLRRAQAFRDLAKGGNVLEIVRSDRVITRFNRQTGEFIAFNSDQTIRTFFLPDDGEKYFKRQAERVNEDE